MMKLDKMRISFWNCGSLSKSTYVAIVKGLTRVSTPKLGFETWFDSKIPKYTADGTKKTLFMKTMVSIWYWNTRMTTNGRIETFITDITFS